MVDGSGAVETLDGTDTAEEPRSERGPGKDRLLDLIRVTAIGRVVMWHTWSWAWLTWIPAMPAMFFVTGALLDGSLGRRGWLTTLKPRLRRLMLPYWLYAAACWVVMLLDGWRPTFGDAARWAVPLLDPVGSEDLPGLWIPLWYLRAYLWFLLASGVIRLVQRRLGDLSVLISAGAAVALWWAGRRGLEVPFAIGDAVTYLPFVLAGMGYGASRRVPARSVLLGVAAASAVGAVATWQRFGPADAVVNRSYLLTMLVGLAGLALVFAFRSRILGSTERWSGLIARVNSRALTIYLWQGFGLVAAQRLVDQRLDPGPLRSLLAIVVVATVIAGAVALFGRVEDRAASRSPDPRPSGRSGHRTSARRAGLMVPAAGLVLAALLVPLPPGASIEAPLSGQAVIARGGLIEEELARRSPRADVSGMTPQEVLDQWVQEHRGRLDDIGATWIDAAIAAPDGTVTVVSWNPDGTELSPTIAWWSMTKAVTAAWLVRLAEDGVVELDDPLAEYVPETPRAQEMTLRQLVTHTSGIPAELDGSLFDAHPADEIRSFIDRGRLAYEPGEGYGYSRIGYYLLALALERASGTTWEEAMRAMGHEAGVTLSLDDDWSEAPVSDPDGHGYRGGLWSSGGLVSELPVAATFLHWLFTDGLSADALHAMTRFPADQERHYYGLALIPVCPCEIVDGWIESQRFGLDTASGTFAVDGPTGAAVMVRPEAWWDDAGPVIEFYDLQQRLLDAVTT
jgi:fucose 4-O-acetylase-like acetyltransferase